MKAGWQDAPLALRDLAVSNMHKIRNSNAKMGGGGGGGRGGFGRTFSQKDGGFFY